MNKVIRVGIVGYGNLGKGVELAIQQNPDMELAAIFTRRFTDGTESSKLVPVETAAKYQDKIDVMILCGGSAVDLPVQGPHFAAMFNTVDSFDTHAKIPEYYREVDAVAKQHNHISVISTGWDPGLFSLHRILSESVMPQGKSYTFWGKGVSQGHSDAIRRIVGVKNAKQYTIPYPEALERVRNGKNPQLTPGESHLRDCYVVPEEGADLEKIAREIRTMPHYFVGYNTHITFISEAEFNENHLGMPHGGFVVHSGATAGENKHVMEFSLKLDSNPEFTSGVLVAYARAAFRLWQEGQSGARTVFDIAPSYLSAKSPEELRAHFL